MATPRKIPEQDPASPLSEHSFSSSESALQAHGQWHSFHHTFHIIEESTGDTVSIWTLFSHTGIYVTAIRSLIPAGLGIFCSYFFWC